MQSVYDVLRTKYRRVTMGLPEDMQELNLKEESELRASQLPDDLPLFIENDRLILNSVLWQLILQFSQTRAKALPRAAA